MLQDVEGLSLEMFIATRLQMIGICYTKEKFNPERTTADV
jgi:hypothetical protein